METDIEKGKTLCHIVPQDFMQLVQLLIADQRTDLVQHNKFLSKYNRTQQFQHNALKNGQPLHRHVSRDVHADILQKWLKLPVQKPGTDDFLPKSFSKDKNVVRNT